MSFVLNNFLSYKDLVGIVVYDKLADEIFITAYKDQEKLKISKQLPESITSHPNISTLLYSQEDNESIGKITMYYDTNRIKNSIIKEQKQELKELDIEIEHLTQELNSQLSFQIIIFIFAGIFVIGILIYIINTIVNKPLLKFEDGLMSFFAYLRDPSKKLSLINIKSHDEFGKMSQTINNSIKQIQQERGITTVYVTHDQEEALGMSDIVCVMYQGIIQQAANPLTIYNQPNNKFVATFVGANNFFKL